MLASLLYRGGEFHPVVVRLVEQHVETAVDGGRQQHEETQVFPHPQPVVQPGGEPGILGSPHQLEVGGQNPGEIAGSQQGESVAVTSLVDVLGEHLPQV